MVKIENISKPGYIGKVETKNRLVMPPMVTSFATADGFVSPQVIEHYETRAKGGVGLIVVEATCVDAPVGKTTLFQLAIDDDRFIPGLSELVQVIRKNGARAFIQLHHAGREAKTKFYNVKPVAPSPIPVSWGDMPEELSRVGIREIIEKFAAGAYRARRAGFDGIEIHGASGYLIAQFLSLAANNRTDEYGGTIEKRARFLLEVVKAIKEAAGDEYPILVRLNLMEFGIDNGITIEEAKATAKMLEGAGVSGIHTSAYGWGRLSYANMPSIPGALIPLIEKIKRAVSIPVIAVGGIDPILGDSILCDGKADFISIGRGLLADPELPDKAFSGAIEDITPCISCYDCIDTILVRNEGLKCTVNPCLGREKERMVTKEGKRKIVVVIGGGPGGLTASRMAALRGHKVTLYEKEREVGGKLITASIPPGKERLLILKDFLFLQAKKAGVLIKHEEATPQKIKGLKPDTVVVAAGSVPIVPEIPGLEKIKAVLAEDVLLGKAEVGQQIAIIGGELVGCEVAEYLAVKEKQVTVMRRGDRILTSLNPVLRSSLMHSLREKGVKFLTGINYKQCVPEGIIIKTKEGEERLIRADTMVIAAGAMPDNEFVTQLKDKCKQLLIIGDCVKPRKIRDAIREGFEAGRAI